MRRDIAEQLAERPWYTSGSTLQVRGYVPAQGHATYPVQISSVRGALLSECAFCPVLGVSVSPVLGFQKHPPYVRVESPLPKPGQQPLFSLREQGFLCPGIPIDWPQGGVAG